MADNETPNEVEKAVKTRAQSEVTHYREQTETFEGMMKVEREESDKLRAELAEARAENEQLRESLTTANDAGGRLFEANNNLRAAERSARVKAEARMAEATSTLIRLDAEIASLRAALDKVLERAGLFYIHHTNVEKGNYLECRFCHGQSPGRTVVWELVAHKTDCDYAAARETLEGKGMTGSSTNTS